MSDLTSRIDASNRERPGKVGVLAWLRSVMQERYGLSIDLARAAAGWRLSLDGRDGVIRLDGDPATFAHADSDLPCMSWDAAAEGWNPVLGKPLPAPGAASLPVPLIKKMADGYVLHYDVLGLVYWVLTRQEEVGRTDLDEHGRFAATSSHAFKHGYLERPVVDEWLDILGQVIVRAWPGVKLKHHEFSVKVSHDVDQAARYGFRPWKGVLRGMAGDALKHPDLRGLAGPWIRLKSRKRLHPLDAFNTFGWLMDVSERRSLQSAFYFICERRGTRYDCDYDLNHPTMQYLLQEIHGRGHEIGLHASYNSYRDPERIAHEGQRLRTVCTSLGIGQQVWGGRMHWLQWSQPVTLRAWSDAGMAYDSTMTYAEAPGFRCGSCFEYQAYDPVAQEALPIKVRPLIVMEGSVIETYGLGLGVGSAARERILRLKNVCRQVGGCFTLLWHNSSLTTRKWRRLYIDVLDG